MKNKQCPACHTSYKPVYAAQPCPNCGVMIVENEPLYVPTEPRLPIDYDRSIHKGERIKKWKYTLTRTFMKGRYGR